MLTRHLTTLTAALFLALPALAEETAMDHSGHDMTGDMGAASTAYMAVNDKMHQDMAIAYTGDADVDFINSMIPHHQGAVDMARVVLEYGKDPEVRKLAEAVIAAQEAEIKWMQEWLAANGS